MRGLPHAIAMLGALLVGAAENDHKPAPKPDDPQAVAALKRLHVSMRPDEHGNIKYAYVLVSHPAFVYDAFKKARELRGRVARPASRMPPVDTEVLKHLTGLYSLQTLRLRSFVSDKHMSHLGNLPNLRSLEIAACPITDAGLVHLKGLPGLESLKISRTAITDAGLIHLKGLRKLREFRFEEGKITGAGLVHLGSAANLQRLDLRDCEITDDGLAGLKDLRSLEHLNLSNTKITDAGLVHLGGMRKLVYLDLGSTQVGDAGLVHLEGLKSLGRRMGSIEINLHPTKVTAEGAAKLRRALPGARIHYVDREPR